MRWGMVRRNRDVVKQIDEFATQISEAGMLCRGGLIAYLKGNLDSFKASLTCIGDSERRGDQLRRSIEEALYRRMLVPESRADITELLESLDTLLDQFKEVIYQFDIETPDIGREFHADYEKLLECAIEAVEADIRSCRAFFSNIYSVVDHIPKVSYWEQESERVSSRLQRVIFSREDLSLSQKMHLRFFAQQIGRIANDAEEVAQRLNICVSKRML